MKSRLPRMYEERLFVEVRRLLLYAASFIDLFRRAATYIDKILRGAKLADLQVEQPTTLELRQQKSWDYDPAVASTAG